MSEHTNIAAVLGVDVGGSHVSSALINTADHSVIEGTFYKARIDAHAECSIVIDQWLQILRTSLLKANDYELKGIGIAMPGPFNYENGISLISGVNKYQSLYGLNVEQALSNHLSIPKELPVIFENDAACFGLGESISAQCSKYKKIIAITLGTGFGATFIYNHQLLKGGHGIPAGGELYNSSYKNGIAEDYISTRWLLQNYNSLSPTKATEVKEIAERAYKTNDKQAVQTFESFGYHLASCLVPWLHSFGAECLIIGGRISKASSLFLPVVQRELEKNEIFIPIKMSEQMELSAIAGAATIVQQKEATNSQQKYVYWRKSSQPLMPAHINKNEEHSEYNIYPFRSIGDGKICSGYDTLAEWIIKNKVVIIDGYVGNDWNAIREQLSHFFKEKAVRALWFETSAFEKSEAEIDEMVKPYLGEKDSVWGKITDLSLKDFYQQDKLESLQPGLSADVNIFIGAGAALCNWQAPVIYIDMPKNELQYRMRAGSTTNLGKKATDAPAAMYKRFYFVDWPALNEHRRNIKNRIAIIADGQWRDDINWAFAASVNQGLEEAAHHVIRVRPWFEAGAWGGQWMKKHIPALNQEEVNYAWSFELIVPENGLVFESDGNLLEVSFDWLMEYDSKAILGKDAARFGTEFPIRFDFLDTFDGGNLSIQCHPALDYIQQEFGERITQDETYYILDCKEGAGVYLGFQEDVDPAKFRTVLEQSNTNNTPIEIEKFVQLHPAKKHDLFLIPNGTIHSAGANNLVLEISATPYIFTFKMYDWLRLDLNGQPRPINIEHAFNNLNFDRKGKKVAEELLSHPYILQKEDDYQVVHLPTHNEHFYDVHRLEFKHEMDIPTEDKCHVLMLVEGQSIIVKTGGETHRFHYAETFVIPAAAGAYQLINEGDEMVKVIKAFIK